MSATQESKAGGNDDLMDCEERNLENVENKDNGKRPVVPEIENTEEQETNPRSVELAEPPSSVPEFNIEEGEELQNDEEQPFRPQDEELSLEGSNTSAMDDPLQQSKSDATAQEEESTLDGINLETEEVENENNADTEFTEKAKNDDSQITQSINVEQDQVDPDIPSGAGEKTVNSPLPVEIDSGVGVTMPDIGNDDKEEDLPLEIVQTKSLAKDETGEGQKKNGEGGNNDDANSGKEGSQNDDDEQIQTVRIRMDGIFETQDDDDDVIAIDDDSDTERNDDPTDVQSMLQMNFEEGDEAETVNALDESVTEIPQEDLSSPSRRPRRAAAAAAASTIREISHEEQLVDNAGSAPNYRRRGRSRDEDYESTTTTTSHRNNSTPTTSINKCQVCQKWGTCEFNIQQFGSVIYVCTNDCLNILQGNRSTDNSRLPCAKCGIKGQDATRDVNYYWETMNFCSETCVGNYQMDVGAKCATCTKNVPWTSLGKYCVRFGSDIRQFCTAGCLENYKKNARVCFHCQLDIKRLGNVILANIPNKNTPKEFCGQDCVEMYVEQNMHQTVKSKSSQLHPCVICSNDKPCYKELILPSEKALKVCNEHCWKQLIDNQKRDKVRSKDPVKCVTCTKYIVMDDLFYSSHSISCEYTVYGFCSATCKNVFVLKSRKIMGCTTCKVKKYNYDLIQYFMGLDLQYAVCSLNCLPKGAEYIHCLKESLIGSGNEISTYGNQRQQRQTQVSSNPRPQPSLSNLLNGDLIMDAYGNITTVGAADLENATLNMSPSELDKFMSTATEEEIVKEFMETWDGYLRPEDVEQLINDHLQVPEMKTKSTMTKPKTATIETQTDESCLADMERVPLKTIEKIRHIPIVLPCPVYLPTPAYLMETPVPFPLILPLPIPIPIPVIFDSSKPNESANSSSNNQEVEMVELDQTDSATGNNSDNVEMMDCSSPDAGPSHAANEMMFQSGNSSDQLLPNVLSSVPSSLTIPIGSSSPDAATSSSPVARKKLTRVEYGIRAWKASYGSTADPLNLSVQELSEKLVEWVNKGTKPNGERYRADIFVYLCLGVQQHLADNNRSDSIFYDDVYSPFVQAITNYAESDCAQGINTRIEDTHFWDSKQLGRSSPGVLLFTLIYSLSKNCNLKTWEKHAALHFGQLRIDTKCEFGQFVKYLSIAELPECKGIEIREKQEGWDRCTIKLLEFYISKCGNPEGPFYRAINPEFTENSSWFTNEPLNQMQLYRMLVRGLMIKSDSELR